MHMNCWTAAIGACVLPNAGGWVNAYRLRKRKGWSKTLRKAPWSPPDWVFAPVWTTLYTSMGYASYLVWKECGRTFGGRATLPLGLYASQLAVNWAWPHVYFVRRSLKWSLVDIVVLCGNATACAVAFYRVDRTAGLLMAPYLAWLALATSLMYRIYRDNPEPVE